MWSIIGSWCSNDRICIFIARKWRVLLGSFEGGCYQRTELFLLQFISDHFLLYCIVVGSRRLMPPDALQPKVYCTNPGL